MAPQHMITCVVYIKIRPRLNTQEELIASHDVPRILEQIIFSKGKKLESASNVKRSFYPAWLGSSLVPNKHTEASINYKLFGLWLSLITNELLQLKLTHNSHLCLATWLGTFSQ